VLERIHDRAISCCPAASGGEGLSDTLPVTACNPEVFALLFGDGSDPGSRHVGLGSVEVPQQVHSQVAFRTPFRPEDDIGKPATTETAGLGISLSPAAAKRLQEQKQNFRKMTCVLFGVLPQL
jgi:hypothetical protein